MLRTNNIILLFGKICSGKSTYAEALRYVLKAHRITVSDIVKRVSGQVSRSELQNTGHMDQLIAKELISEIKKYDKVIVDGIRQYSIVVELAAEFGLDAMDYIWLEVPDYKRRNRFYDRAVAKDDITFEEADARDAKLGLLELQEKLKDSYTIINN